MSHTAFRKDMVITCTYVCRTIEDVMEASPSERIKHLKSEYQRVQNENSMGILRMSQISKRSSQLKVVATDGQRSRDL